MRYIIPLILSLSCQETDKKPVQNTTGVQPSESTSLMSSWEVRFTDNTLRAPYESSVGWQNYYNREYKQALPLFNGEALARLHLELSALNRQALLMHSYSVKYAYSEYKQETDGSEVAYFQGIAACFLGEYEEAKSFLSKDLKNPDLVARAAQWKTWLDGDKTTLPILNNFFFSDAGASAKSLPKWEQTSHYSLPSAGNNNMEMSEGTALWLQAKWHEDQAVSILKDAGKATELAALTLAPWRLPFEAKIKNELPDTTSTLSDDWLFFSFFLVPQDAHFLAAMNNNPQDALNTWKDKSILAALLSKCMDSGKLIPERVIDASAVLEKDILTLVKERTDIPLFYEVFPLFAKYSLLRAGALFAEANGQHRDSGMLRLNVREASGPVRDPVFLIAFSAWEAGNKSTQRAQDLIHEYASQFPALHSARVPLDSLHIRRGKETVPVGPTH